MPNICTSHEIITYMSYIRQLFHKRLLPPLPSNHVYIVETNTGEQTVTSERMSVTSEHTRITQIQGGARGV